MYTQLGVMTKGTVIEVNVSELGLVTTGGKAVWGKYAQVTNNPVSLMTKVRVLLSDFLVAGKRWVHQRCSAYVFSSTLS